MSRKIIDFKSPAKYSEVRKQNVCQLLVQSCLLMLRKIQTLTRWNAGIPNYGIRDNEVLKNSTTKVITKNNSYICKASL